VIAVAATVEALRTPLFDELEEILGAFASLVKPAQDAVVAVVMSLIDDPAATRAERDLATALYVLARASQ
jgi:hypothetical protein